MTICELDAVTVNSADGGTLLRDVGLSLSDGAKVAVVGANRAAASALLEMIAIGRPDDVAGLQRDESVTVEYVGPNPSVDPSLTVWDFVATAAAEAQALNDRIDFLLKYHLQHTEDDELPYMEELDRLERRKSGLGAWDLDRRMRTALEALRCPANNAVVGALSAAELRRAMVCRALVARPQLLVLDQPTDDLDAETVAWLEQSLAQFKGTLVVATNDRAVINAAINTMVVIDGDSARVVDASYAGWLERRVSETASGLQRTAIERELSWVRDGTPPRSSEARPGASGVHGWLARRGEAAAEPTEITIAPGPRLGHDVIELRHVSKGANERLLIDDLSLRIPPGAIVGVIGGADSGKSTLLGLLAGLEAPDDGAVRIDGSVVLGLLNRDTIQTAPNVATSRFITGGRERIEVGERTVEADPYMSALGIDRSLRELTMADLSPNARTRAHLAKLLLAGVNMVLLDDIIKDFDIDTLRALEDALQRYSGCAVIVSSDRWFLNRVATHMLAFEGDSRATWVEGNYDRYVTSSMRRRGRSALQPNRLRFKRMPVAASS